jgi:hypothetical protein
LWDAERNNTMLENFGPVANKRGKKHGGKRRGKK